MIYKIIDPRNLRGKCICKHWTKNGQPYYIVEISKEESLAYCQSCGDIKFQRFTIINASDRKVFTQPK